MPDASPPPPLSSSEQTKGPTEVHPAFREFLNTHSSPAIRQYLANNPDLIDPDQRLPQWLEWLRSLVRVEWRGDSSHVTINTFLVLVAMLVLIVVVVLGGGGVCGGANRAGCGSC